MVLISRVDSKAESPVALLNQPVSWSRITISAVLIELSIGEILVFESHNKTGLNGALSLILLGYTICNLKSWLIVAPGTRYAVLQYTYL
jgi:hypothetical protein